MPRPFITAAWTNIAVITWQVDPGLLRPYIPPTLRLDLRDSMAFVSLLGLQFSRLRVRGVPVLGHQQFDEINLRIYVQKTGYRGVTFIREYAPRRLAALMARLLYAEPYRTGPVRGRITTEGAAIVASYQLDHAGRTNTLTISGQRPAIRPDKTTLESFLLEQQWGFSRTRSGRLLRYEVEHPAWLVYPVGSYALDFDFAGVYGPEWGVLNGAEPRSLVLAAGSEVTISRPRRVRLTDEVEERRAKEHAD